MTDGMKVFSRGVHCFLERAAVGAGFNTNQAKATSESTDNQAQLIEQVESGMATGWLKWKPVPTLAIFFEKDLLSTVA